jgi:hypothetical protein
VLRKRKKNKTKTIQRNLEHRVHKRKKNKTKTIQRNLEHRVQTRSKKRNNGHLNITQ